MCVVIDTPPHLPAISTGQVTECIVLVHGMWWATYILVDLEGFTRKSVAKDGDNSGRDRHHGTDQPAR